MKLACIGGGPAGLYLGILIKRSAPEHDVVVYERNRPEDTFGFGVVFSDATLGHLAAADPDTHAQIMREFARWDDIEVHAGGEVLRSTGHGFCGLERKTLLNILQQRATELGVRLEFEHAITSLAQVQADVIVGCDGVGSWVRDALAPQLQPSVDVRPNKFVWLGCTVPYRAFTFIFKPSRFGLFRVHAYPFSKTMSTFIVECREDTWRNAGLDQTDEDGTIAVLAEVFAEELAGHPLIKNRSIWRSFPTVRCGSWHAGNVVLLGDAAHTAHFSIGSGTKLAMEDSIALRDALLANTDNIPTALAAYQARRKPEVEALQAAAQASLEWFEGTERYMRMAPVQLVYSLMTRSLRVSHASVAKRDPHLARGVEQLLAGGAARPPTSLALTLGDRVLATRIAVAAEHVVHTVDSDDAAEVADALDDVVSLGAAARAGAKLVVTRALTASELATDDAAVAWARVVDYVHGKGALIVARLTVDAMLDAAVERASYAGFDMLLLDAADREQLPAAVQDARQRWRVGGPIAARVHDQAGAAAFAAQLVRAGADLLWITADPDGNARLPAATLADRLRNELNIATAIDGADALLPDLDAAIAAGRADLVVTTRLP